MPQSKSLFTIKVFAASAALFLLVALLWFSGGGKQGARPPAAPGEEEEVALWDREVTHEPAPVLQPPALPTTQFSDPVVIDKRQDSLESGEVNTAHSDTWTTPSGLVPAIWAQAVAQETPAMDPNMQPRAYYATDFTKSDTLPLGFISENIQVTERGIELLPGGAPEDGSLRTGFLESPGEAFEFPANGLVPLFRENVPEGTSIRIEIAVSPDGQNWGEWNLVDYDREDLDEISPTFPDGSPNPNYGYVPAGLMFCDLRLYNYFRYRVTLTSSSALTPSFEAFRVYYMDSTLGEGRLAEARENPSISPNNP